MVSPCLIDPMRHGKLASMLTHGPVLPGGYSPMNIRHPNSWADNKAIGNFQIRVCELRNCLNIKEKEDLRGACR